ncbi:unnamed protein product [Fraxinus pennsylvanica]|uniref:Uncharacterized protein n=1 Tax=Fraxinus pennsylvanica TaxID=56036 RepID=A0AAD1Z2E4_9LAMI|nr:unnamed protein product [Fraxinus pennsylvanica]
MLPDESSISTWSREQDMQFEKAIANYPEESSDRWEKIADIVSGKSLEEVKDHFELLVDDVNRIESGCVPLPCYNSSSDGTTSNAVEEGTRKKGGNFEHLNNSGNGGKGSRPDQDRRKGIAWTEDEHRRFLAGLDKHGKGDWRSISRNYVVTRTPTQVASHAQKYYNRLNSMNRERRRSSIHDITNVNTGDLSVPQHPITGQTNGLPAGGLSVTSNRSTPQTSAGPRVGMYGAPTIGHPMGGPLVSAVGTPVNGPLNVSASAHVAYGVPGPVVTGAPLNMGPMTYPVPQTSTHR